MLAKHLKRPLLAAALLLLFMSPMGQERGASAQAQTTLDFPSFAKQLGERALREGVRQQTVDMVIPTLTLNQKVIGSDRGQPGGGPTAPTPKFAPYRARHVDAARINRGRERYQALRPLLSRVERETGVPESIMVAIWGHETNYGLVKGNYDLAEALASLAYEGRRRELFASEFVAVLKLIDRGIPRWKLKGSWAGATGHPQFLPSMYIRLGKDGDGDGKIDIWDNEADALASIANYFANAGWRTGRPWAVSAAVGPSFNREAVVNRMTAPRCPRVHMRHSKWMTVSEWRRLGVSPLQTGLSETEMVSFFEPDGPGTPAWLITGNYKVILEYNCSNFYALSVGLLADALAN
ncbi:MAG: hypothetical protein RIS52_249 [Pseudomonadota bacterium]